MLIFLGGGEEGVHRQPSNAEPQKNRALKRQETKNVNGRGAAPVLMQPFTFGRGDAQALNKSGVVPTQLADRTLLLLLHNGDGVFKCEIGLDELQCAGQTYDGENPIVKRRRLTLPIAPSSCIDLVYIIYLLDHTFRLFSNAQLDRRRGHGPRFWLRW